MLLSRIQRQPGGREFKFVQGLMYRQGKVQSQNELCLDMQICFPEIQARKSGIRLISALLPP